MKRSEINQLIRDARTCFEAHGWTLPPEPVWDVTDFGLGDWRNAGLVLVNLADEPEYCEKLMYAKKGMVTVAHTHVKKKEDIISRWGELAITVWKGKPQEAGASEFELPVNHKPKRVKSGDTVVIKAGERVTLVPGIYHSFVPATDECVIGEVSTANDDVNDNVFERQDIGRFPGIEEDEPPIVRLVSERT